MHVAFVAPSRAAVDAFYAAAIKAGGKDNGAPGLRPHYHANYYGAFFFDPDGNNVEAVCHNVCADHEIQRAQFGSEKVQGSGGVT